MLIAHFQKNYLSLTKMSDIHPKNTFAVKKGAPKKLQVPGTQCKKQKEKTA